MVMYSSDFDWSMAPAQSAAVLLEGRLCGLCACVMLHTVCMQFGTTAQNAVEGPRHMVSPESHP